MSFTVRASATGLLTAPVRVNRPTTYRRPVITLASEPKAPPVSVMAGAGKAKLEPMPEPAVQNPASPPQVEGIRPQLDDNHHTLFAAYLDALIRAQEATDPEEKDSAEEEADRLWSMLHDENEEQIITLATLDDFFGGDDDEGGSEPIPGGGRSSRPAPRESGSGSGHYGSAGQHDLTGIKHDPAKPWAEYRGPNGGWGAIHTKTRTRRLGESHHDLNERHQRRMARAASAGGKESEDNPYPGWMVKGERLTPELKADIDERRKRLGMSPPGSTYDPKSAPPPVQRAPQQPRNHIQQPQVSLTGQPGGQQPTAHLLADDSVQHPHVSRVHAHFAQTHEGKSDEQIGQELGKIVGHYPRESGQAIASRYGLGRGDSFGSIGMKIRQAVKESHGKRPEAAPQAASQQAVVPASGQQSAETASSGATTKGSPGAPAAGTPYLSRTPARIHPDASPNLPNPKMTPEQYRAAAIEAYKATRIREQREKLDFIGRHHAPKMELTPDIGEQGKPQSKLQQPPTQLDPVEQSRSDELPPPKPGMVRLYHGGHYDPGQKPGWDIQRNREAIGPWVSPQKEYAEGYARKTAGSKLHYIDLPENHPIVQQNTNHEMVAGTNMKAPIGAFELPHEIASKHLRLHPDQTEAIATEEDLYGRNIDDVIAQHKPGSREYETLQQMKKLSRPATSQPVAPPTQDAPSAPAAPLDPRHNPLLDEMFNAPTPAPKPPAAPGELRKNDLLDELFNQPVSPEELAKFKYIPERPAEKPAAAPEREPGIDDEPQLTPDQRWQQARDQIEAKERQDALVKQQMAGRRYGPQHHALREKARQAGHNPDHVQSLADETLQVTNQFVQERNELLRHARDKAASSDRYYDPKKRTKDSRGQWTGEGVGGAEDHAGLKGFDEIAEEVQRIYPLHFKPETGEHGSHLDQLFDMLQQGNLPLMSPSEAFQDAMDKLEEEQYRREQNPQPQKPRDPDDDIIPFGSDPEIDDNLFYTLAALPDAADFIWLNNDGWERYQGPRHGVGWRNVSTGRIVYTQSGTAPGFRRRQQQSSQQRARELGNQYAGHLRGHAGHKPLTEAELQELATHVQSLPVHSLKSLKGLMMGTWGSVKRRQHMVEAMTGHVKSLVGKRRSMYMPSAAQMTQRGLFDQAETPAVESQSVAPSVPTSQPAVNPIRGGAIAGDEMSRRNFEELRAKADATSNPGFAATAFAPGDQSSPYDRRLEEWRQAQEANRIPDPGNEPQHWNKERYQGYAQVEGLTPSMQHDQLSAWKLGNDHGIPPAKEQPVVSPQAQAAQSTPQVTEPAPPPAQAEIDQKTEGQLDNAAQPKQDNATEPSRPADWKSLNVSQYRHGGSASAADSKQLADSYAGLDDREKTLFAEQFGIENAARALPETRDELVNRKIKELEFKHGKDAPELNTRGGLFGERGVGESADLFDRSEQETPTKPEDSAPASQEPVENVSGKQADVSDLSLKQPVSLPNQLPNSSETPVSKGREETADADVPAHEEAQREQLDFEPLDPLYHPDGQETEHHTPGGPEHIGQSLVDAAQKLNSDDPKEEAEGARLVDELMGKINKLPSEQRKVAMLHAFGDGRDDDDDEGGPAKKRRSPRGERKGKRLKAEVAKEGYTPDTSSDEDYEAAIEANKQKGREGIRKMEEKERERQAKKAAASEAIPIPSAEHRTANDDGELVESASGRVRKLLDGISTGETNTDRLEEEMAEIGKLSKSQLDNLLPQIKISGKATSKGQALSRIRAVITQQMDMGAKAKGFNETNPPPTASEPPTASQPAADPYARLTRRLKYGYEAQMIDNPRGDERTKQADYFEALKEFNALSDEDKKSVHRAAFGQEYVEKPAQKSPTPRPMATKSEPDLAAEMKRDEHYRKMKEHSNRSVLNHYSDQQAEEAAKEFAHLDAAELHAVLQKYGMKEASLSDSKPKLLDRIKKELTAARRSYERTLA